jgi:cysteine desulfurase
LVLCVVIYGRAQDKPEMIYADYNAARPPHPDVLAAYIEAEKSFWANSASVHHLGRSAKRALDNARASVAAMIGSKTSELVFTSGGTESNFLALLGTKATSLMLSQVEHPSVLQAAERFQQNGGEVFWVQTPDQLLQEIPRRKPGLVSLMLAQNETGEIFSVAEVTKEAKKVGALVYCDAVQAIGRLSVDVEQLGVDLLSISGRKLGGVGSVGALYVRRGLTLSPMMPGTGEGGRRAGSVSVPDAVAFGVAAKLAVEKFLPAATQIEAYKKKVAATILQKIPGAIETIKGRPCLGNTAHFIFPGIDGEDLLVRLDEAGVCASTGAACTSGTKQPSHVLLALGYTPEEARGSLRLSIGPETTQEEIERLIEIIARAHQESAEDAP